MAGIRRFAAVIAAAIGAGADAVVVSGQAEFRMSPVTRVVELLNSMSTRIEADGRAEEDAYETFVCWAKSIISQKQKSNAAAQSRADSLQTYMDDLSAGRIELTSERVDLEKEIDTLSKDIEVATQMREQEARDFDMAKEELNAAIAALEKAIEVLRTATEDHVLMSLKTIMHGGSEARAREAAALTHAVELGSRVLSKGDAVFLQQFMQRLLTGNVPGKKDWKKLNRKATFKMSYKARSLKIQHVLATLLETFSGNVREAAAKEARAVEVFNKLMEAKGDQKTAAQDALSKMEKEGGARQLSMVDAGEERTALLKQINDDTGYIGQVQSALDTKKEEWSERKALRAAELAAISKAVQTLHSDDARDLFKKSFASQGLLFLQEGASRASKRADGVARALRTVAWKAHDSRLAALAALATSGHFDAVLSAIDMLIGELQSEEQTDLDNKEACESERANDTRVAIKTSREIDELTDTITALESHVAELAAEIERKEEAIVEINAELNETAEMRAKENAAYLSAKSDDQEAITIIDRARDTLETFYRDNGLMFVQGKHSKKAPFTSTAGEAPPPPPATWEESYGGKTAESTGIIAILGMIKDDIGKDIQKADNEEAAAVTLYEKTKEDLENDRDELTQMINDVTREKTTAEGDIQDNEADRSSKKGSLKLVMDKMKALAPGCDFVTINFQLRSKNRNIEIDGLEKAKAILSGASFQELPDPNRELKPGDAAALAQSSKEGRRKFLRHQS